MCHSVFAHDAHVRNLGELVSERISAAPRRLLIDMHEDESCVRDDVADESTYHREVAVRLDEEHLPNGHPKIPPSR
jgi:hypothetical protein